MTEPLWQRLRSQLTPISANAAGDFTAQAAVLVLLTDDTSNPELVFTLRAAHLSSHAGEVAFPGGMWEVEDESLARTALRETHEEIGVPPSAVTLLGARPMRPTRAGVKVTPYVGTIAADTPLCANPEELQCVFRVPLTHFHRQSRIRTDIFEANGHRWSVPAYRFDDYEIWGFTAALTLEILDASGRLET